MFDFTFTKRIQYQFIFNTLIYKEFERVAMASILVVDDELSMREFLKILLQKQGHQVTLAADGENALKLGQNTLFDLLISDIRMPGISGLELMPRFRALHPDIIMIMVTAFASPDDAVTAMKHGAFDYITKPFNVDEIKSVVEAALKKQPQASRAAKGFPEIIGQSPEMIKIFDMINKIAPTPANVLIYGESGTGKELVAKAIHNHSLGSVNSTMSIPRGRFLLKPRDGRKWIIR